jgi:hypothetical protein
MVFPRGKQLETVERVHQTTVAQQEAASMAQTLIAREKADAEAKERSAQTEIRSAPLPPGP